MYSSTLNFPVASSKNFIKFMEAKLQAVLSKNIYSEQGLDAFILPFSGQVCHSLIVVSYCTPGSAHCHAAKAIFCQMSLALTVLWTLPSVLLVKSQFLSSKTASINPFETLTE